MIEIRETVKEEVGARNLRLAEELGVGSALNGHGLRGRLRWLEATKKALGVKSLTDYLEYKLQTADK